VAILPRDANEEIHIVRLEPVRWQITLERFLLFELLVKPVPFFD
jgi:hypothetical protein